jgi:hypothetical protein
MGADSFPQQCKPVKHFNFCSSRATHHCNLQLDADFGTLAGSRDKHFCSDAHSTLTHAPPLLPLATLRSPALRESAGEVEGELLGGRHMFVIGAARASRLPSEAISGYIAQLGKPTLKHN